MIVAWRICRRGRRQILWSHFLRRTGVHFAGKCSRNKPMPKKFHLAFDISYTHLDGRWRMPGSWVGRTYPDLEIYEEIARISERGCIDMLFFGDGTGIPDTWAGSRDEAVRWGIGWPRHDMSPVITA